MADIWNIARDWAGIQSSGSKHLDYYKIKMSYLKVDKDETKQEFFYRLRDAMEDTLILKADKITDDGQIVTEDEDMTPTVKSLVVLDWLDAIGGPALVEHVHRVYAKELESATLSSLQTRIWKNIDSLMREIDEVTDEGKAFRAVTANDATCRQVGNLRGRGFGRGRGFSRGRGQPQRSFSYNQQQGRGNFSNRGGFRGSAGTQFCKLCKASGSNNFTSHDISECWLLSERDRNNILKASAKAQAMFATEQETNYNETRVFDEDQEGYEEENDEEDVDYD